MITFLLSTQLNCFTDNTLVVLSKQSRQPTFTAQLLTLKTKDYVVCQSLLGSSFTISLYFGAFVYTYPSSQTLSGSISLAFPCTDVNHCDAAFLATSASFKLTFPDTNTIVEDAISVFKIDKYNRLNCLTNPMISYTAATNSLQIKATTGACEVQIRQNTNAVVKLLVYPDFVIQKSFPLTSVTQLSHLFVNMVMNCDTDFTGSEKRVCQRIMQTFQESYNNKAELTVSLPAIVPGPGALYDRESVFSLFTVITAITSSFANQFDCFTTSQAVFLKKMIRITNTLNNSAVNCILPFNQFIGDIDSTIRLLRVTDSDDTAVEFKFSSTSQVIRVQRTWMECQDDLFGEQQCLDNIQTVLRMKSPQAIISREFVKQSSLVKQVQNALSARAATRASAIVTLNESTACVSTTNIGDPTQYYQIQLDFTVGDPRFQLDQHTDVLTLRSQVLYPGSGVGSGQFGKYCFSFTFSDQQQVLFKNLLKSKSQVTGWFIQHSLTTKDSENVFTIQSVILKTQSSIFKQYNDDYVKIFVFKWTYFNKKWWSGSAVAVALHYIDFNTQMHILRTTANGQPDKPDIDADSVKNIQLRITTLIILKAMSCTSVVARRWILRNL
ncbi:Conserved_hypothetical protein [Hexamita inflata]|uniref:Uncharacterized protein n=1 Tax=Hexamita inflata TaxID=28002 RepID=A0AA86RSC7_9EUKA|nr:Conserved hypothetical protein [Hexamita inflata]